MENLILYLVKSSALLLLFFATYHFLLKKETFFHTNRWFLLFGIFSSALFPLISFQKIVWVEAVAATVKITQGEIPTSAVTNLPSVESPTFPWELALSLLYGIGVLVFLMQTLIQLYSFNKIIRNKNVKTFEGLQFIEVDEAVSPFSFFNKIVYNPRLFDSSELKNIIEHEKIHARQLHSLDVLLSRLYCILFWWNPVVWIYKKAIVQNLEFIADQNAIAQIQDKKSYFFTLLKITTAEKHVAITNHFYQSLIKKRIVMLNTNQSKKRESWKYFIVLPALVLFMMIYQVEVVAQTRQSAKITAQTEAKTLADSNYEMELQWNKDTKDADFEEHAKILKSVGVLLKVSKVKRNKNGEITGIKLSIKDKAGHEQKKQISGSEPINPMSFVQKSDSEGNIAFDIKESANVLDSKQHSKINKEMVNVEMDITYPDAPTPPTPPTPPNYPAPPVMPEFPTAPKAPNAPLNLNNKKAWNDFESKMKIFEEKMNSAEMKKFNLETQKYADAIVAMEVESAEFEKKMGVFEKEMLVFDKKIQSITDEVIKKTSELRNDINK